MPKIDWNAPGVYYRLQYRKVKDKPLVWEERNITDPTVGMFTVQERSRCELWEFRICAANDEGLGPFSAIEQSYFAPHIPKGKPENVTVANITAQSVNIAWAPVADLKDEGSDGYRVSSCKFLKFCSYVGIDKIGERELALVKMHYALSLTMCSAAYTTKLCCSPSPLPTFILYYLSYNSLS